MMSALAQVIDPIMDRLAREERQFHRKLVLALIVVGAISAAVGWKIGSLPPRPIIVLVQMPA